MVPQERSDGVMNGVRSAIPDGVAPAARKTGLNVGDGSVLKLNKGNLEHAEYLVG
ncbi:MAG: hypothetical protein IIB03_08380 [Acidobacteria bacterium]|nr:hypothetical protein [Acidobacteriota bacterium]